MYSCRFAERLMFRKSLSVYSWRKAGPIEPLLYSSWAFIWMQHRPLTLGQMKHLGSSSQARRQGLHYGSVLCYQPLDQNHLKLGPPGWPAVNTESYLAFSESAALMNDSRRGKYHIPCTYLHPQDLAEALLLWNINGCFDESMPLSTVLWPHIYLHLQGSRIAGRGSKRRRAEE